jgi:hypothetical protein
MVNRGFWDPGQLVKVVLPNKSVRQGKVVSLPFH